MFGNEALAGVGWNGVGDDSAPLLSGNNGQIFPSSLKQNCHAPYNYFATALQILKNNAAAPQLPKNIQQCFLKCFQLLKSEFFIVNENYTIYSGDLTMILSLCELSTGLTVKRKVKAH